MLAMGLCRARAHEENEFSPTLAYREMCAFILKEIPLAPLYGNFSFAGTHPSSVGDLKRKEADRVKTLLQPDIVALPASNAEVPLDSVGKLSEKVVRDDVEARRVLSRCCCSARVM